jgi:hypothetical protein
MYGLTATVATDATRNMTASEPRQSSMLRRYVEALGGELETAVVVSSLA